MHDRTSRRQYLQGLLALGAVSMTRSDASTLDQPPRERVEDLIRVIGCNDGEIAVRWTDGVMTGHIGAETIPLMRVLSQIFSRHRRRSDGGYDTVVFELAYFADINTGELLETWRNPLTGVSVSVPKTVLGPTPYIITPQCTVIRELRYSGGAPFSHLFSLEFTGNDLWVTESLNSVMPSPQPDSPAFGFHENFVYQTDIAALKHSAAPHVDTVVQKVNVLSWRPWMLMGAQPGHTMTRAYGRVTDNIGRLPEVFHSLNSRHGASILADLERVLRFDP